MVVIACCVSLFAGVVTFLTFQGVPVLLGFLGVYLVAVWCMLGMQRRARESYGCAEHPRRRHREPSIREARPIDDLPDLPAPPRAYSSSQARRSVVPGDTSFIA